MSTALEILFIGHPVKTSLGVVIGGIIAGLPPAIKPLLDSYILPLGVDITKIPDYTYILLGVAIFHIRSIYIHLFTSSTTLSEQYEQEFAVIDKLKEKISMSPEQEALLYRKTAELVLSKIVFDQTTEKEYQEFLKNSGSIEAD